LLSRPALLEEIRAEKARRSLHVFMRQAWHVVEPGTPFVDGWHLHAICAHLEAVSAGHIRNLLINIPPRHAKSLTVAVFWPTWEWLTHPERRWLFASYALSLSVRDSLKCRRLILSPWYQRNYGHLYRLTDDQNAKLRFENDKTGYRLSTSVDSAATGEGGDRLVVDDPHNVREAESEATRASTITWWDETMSTRLNDQRTGAKVIVMQRVHASDLSGHVLEQGGYEHLCLPAEYEPTTHRTGIGWRDPRTHDGDLLWPERVGPPEIAALKVQLGTYGYAGQMQQRPSPRAGGLFKRAWWRSYDPATFVRYQALEVIQVWDTAFQEKTSADYSVCATWARTPEGAFVLDVYRARLEFPDLKRQARALYAQWQPAVVLVEDKASGQSLIQELRRPDERDPERWPRLPVLAVPVDRDKLARATAVTPYVEAGMVHLPDVAPWVADWVQEHADFPNAPHDDQVDTTSMALRRFFGTMAVEALDDDLVATLAGYTGY
jgi:predicted phage terminase large subunit-like protein